jgi:molybdopterin-guanine dinucleotide biosynthesis protein MobB
MRVMVVIGKCAAKSGVVSRIVAAATARGLRVSTIKRVRDEVDLDRPGTGTWHHRAAGAQQVMLASGSRVAVMEEAPPGQHEPDVEALLARLAAVDLVLLEGFRGVVYPKIEVLEPAQDRRPQAFDDASVRAVVAATPVPAPVPWIALDDSVALLACVLAEALPPGQPVPELETQP